MSIKSRVIRGFGEFFLWGEEEVKFVKRFNLFNPIWHKWPVQVTFDEEAGLYRVSDSVCDLWIARSRRLVFYCEGVEKRLNALAWQYLLDRVPLEQGDVVIDVGANVGEIGAWLKKEKIESVYVAIEPSIKECRANKMNNPNAICMNVGAWKEDAELTFFDRNDTGDSSLFRVAREEDGEKIRVVRLDEVLSDGRFNRIKLMKMEAEGAEPEAIEGAKGVLKKVDYITVDCGFERGAEEKSTADEVIRLLSEEGFLCIGCNPERLVLLFRNGKSG